jgi:hypothetical protein
MLRQVLRVRVLDPACGCGNFLIVSYRELRLVEQASDSEDPPLQRNQQLDAPCIPVKRVRSPPARFEPKLRSGLFVHAFWRRSPEVIAQFLAKGADGALGPWRRGE